MQHQEAILSGWVRLSGMGRQNPCLAATKEAVVMLLSEVPQHVIQSLLGWQCVPSGQFHLCCGCILLHIAFSSGRRRFWKPQLVPWQLVPLIQRLDDLMQLLSSCE